MKKFFNDVNHVMGIYAMGLFSANLDVEPMLKLQTRLRHLQGLVTDLTKSIEYYAACNKPREEWDEYDRMMYPIWLRLKEFIEE